MGFPVRFTQILLIMNLETSRTIPGIARDFRRCDVQIKVLSESMIAEHTMRFTGMTKEFQHQQNHNDVLPDHMISTYKMRATEITWDSRRWEIRDKLASIRTQVITSYCHRGST